MTKDELIHQLSVMGVPSDYLEDVRDEIDHIDWESVNECSVKLANSMPGIGFASTKQRYAAFKAVCRHTDVLIERGELGDSADVIYVFLVLRLTSKRFKKAIETFDFYANRIRAAEASELPSSAYTYWMSLRTR